MNTIVIIYLDTSLIYEQINYLSRMWTCQAIMVTCIWKYLAINILINIYVQRSI